MHPSPGFGSSPQPQPEINALLPSPDSETEFTLTHWCEIEAAWFVPQEKNSDLDGYLLDDMA